MGESTGVGWPVPLHSTALLLHYRSAGTPPRHHGSQVLPPKRLPGHQCSAGSREHRSAANNLTTRKPLQDLCSKNICVEMQERVLRPKLPPGPQAGRGLRKGTIFHPTLGYPIQPPVPVTVQRRSVAYFDT